MEVLHPEYEFMFQRTRRAAKAFNINTAKVLFEDSKLGKNTTPLCMPKICKILDLPRRYTNHCVRATGINILKRSGIDDRDIVKLTGHKAVSSLSCYVLQIPIDESALCKIYEFWFSKLFWLFCLEGCIARLAGLHWKMRSRSLIRYKKCNVQY